MPTGAEAVQKAFPLRKQTLAGTCAFFSPLKCFTENTNKLRRTTKHGLMKNTLQKPLQISQKCQNTFLWLHGGKTKGICLLNSI